MYIYLSIIFHFILTGEVFYKLKSNLDSNFTLINNYNL